MAYKCVQKVKELAEQHGAELDHDCLEGGDIIIDAPKGYVWVDSDCSIIVEAASMFGGSGTWWSVACSEATKRMKSGLRKADEAEIKDIEHARDEPWRATEDQPERIEVK